MKANAVQRTHKYCFWGVCCLFVLFIAYRFFSSHTDMEIQTRYEIHGIPVIRQDLPHDTKARPGMKRSIRWIVIHETDNEKEGANAKAHSSFLHSQASKQALSWHYTVDDHEIYQNLPDDEIAYHASDQLKRNGGNRNGIGIEICVNEDGDYQKALLNTQYLVAYLMKQYNLPIQNVKKHQDFSGKLCPARLIANNGWDAFLRQIQQIYDQMMKQEQNQ